MIIQNRMSIYCRTEDELQVFLEVATKEGWKYCDGSALKSRQRSAPVRFNAGLFGEIYPNAFTYGRVDSPRSDNGIIEVEASSLFRNQLIARRIKHDKGTT